MEAAAVVAVAAPVTCSAAAAAFATASVVKLTGAASFLRYVRAPPLPSAALCTVSCGATR